MKDIKVRLSDKDIEMLDKFLQADAGRLLDMRIPSSRLVWSILTQINLRGKK